MGRRERPHGVGRMWMLRRELRAPNSQGTREGRSLGRLTGMLLGRTGGVRQGMEEIQEPREATK